MNLVDAIGSRNLIKDHGNGLIEYKEFWDNNNLFRHWFELNDKKHGRYKYYRSNGQKWIECNYKNGNYCGERKVWDEDGTLKEHELYENGKFIKDYLK